MLRIDSQDVPAEFFRLLEISRLLTLMGLLERLRNRNHGMNSREVTSFPCSSRQSPPLISGNARRSNGILRYSARL